MGAQVGAWAGQWDEPNFPGSTKTDIIDFYVFNTGWKANVEKVPQKIVRIT